MTRKKGITLAELMVAIVILVTSVLLLMGMFSAGTIRIRQARAVATAAFLAKEKMEEVLAELDTSDVEGSFTIPFDGYGYKVTRSEYKETPALEQVEVTVTAPQSLGGKKVKVVMLRAL
jgi:type II secretory pathway pseudopilin PulG